MSSNGSQQVVQRLWNYCSVLRDDGLSYGDYVEQLTFLLFLKMAHEQTQPPWSRPSPIPEAYAWPSLLKRDGDALESHYRHLLEALGKEKGMLGLIFRKAQNNLDEFVDLYKPENRHARKQTWSEKNPEGRWRVYTYEELLARDEISLDIFWLRDESLANTDNLPDPDVIAGEIAEDLRDALSLISEMDGDLKPGVP